MELLISGFGIFTSFILFYYMRDLNKSNRLLAAFFFTTNFNVLYFYVMVFPITPFGKPFFQPFFAPNVFGLPLAVFYIKFSFRPAKFKWSDLWHYAPAIFIFIFSIPYTTLSFEEKYKLAHNLINESSIYSPQVVALAFYFRAIYRFGYTIFIFFYFRWVLEKSKPSGGRPPNKSIFSYLDLLFNCDSIIKFHHSIRLHQQRSRVFLFGH